MSVEDKAQELEALEWQRNNRVRTQATYTPDHEKYGPSLCEDCDDEMTPERRALGKKHCVFCTEIHDRQKKLRAA